MGKKRKNKPVVKEPEKQVKELTIDDLLRIGRETNHVKLAKPLYKKNKEDNENK